jgi:dUTP pyrophosphatase
MKIKIEVINRGTAPVYAQAGDAGADIFANESVEIRAGERKLVMTGVKIAVPDGYVGLIHPRSGLALKQGLTVLNAPGTIDSGYRGEIGVILYNSQVRSTILIKAGDRIAQLVIQKVERAEFEVVDALDNTDRGEGGFGSTGVN